jgi:H/ACA ribonucleoprotein complex subunit 4
MLKKGIVFADKPAGITSFQLVERIRKKLDAKKAGHSGTLDMGVTGVMLVALDEATKAMPVLIGLDKEYEGVMHIHKDTEPDELEETVKSFTGKITQIPPRKSAVKREPRQRIIYSFEILSNTGRSVRFRVRCESGTYIRKLCSDIGEKLGCGAHMAKLRRTRLGPFTIRECVKPGNLRPEHIKPLEYVLERTGLKKIQVKDRFTGRIMNGMPLKEQWVEKKDKNIKRGETIGLYSENHIIALAIFKQREMAKTERIFKA